MIGNIAELLLMMIFPEIDSPSAAVVYGRMGSESVFHLEASSEAEIRREGREAQVSVCLLSGLCQLNIIHVTGQWGQPGSSCCLF